MIIVNTCICTINTKAGVKSMQRYVGLATRHIDQGKMFIFINMISLSRKLNAEMRLGQETIGVG